MSESQPPYFDELMPMLTPEKVARMREMILKMRRKEFLKEVERRAGSNKSRMLDFMIETKQPYARQLTIWLRRILGEAADDD